MNLILAFVLSLPTLFEAWMDRRGEDASGKRKDTLWLLFVGALLSVFLWRLSGVEPWKTIALLLAWRVLVLDYLVSYLLIKNDVVVGNWYSYMGTTSKRWDKYVAKIPWKLRMAIRVVLFAASLWWFLI